MTTTKSSISRQLGLAVEVRFYDARRVDRPVVRAVLIPVQVFVENALFSELEDSHTAT